MSRAEEHKNKWEKTTPHAIKAILLLGEKHDLTNVSVPLMENGKGRSDEDEAFTWFSEREKQLSADYQLQPITDHIPLLNKIQTKAKR